jgi:tryptophan 2,3-dioxygenase
MSAEPPSEQLSYGTYLRVPELLELQSPVGRPAVHDEMLFIILQQAQELWFKQLLHELHEIVDLMLRGELPEATRLLHRVTRILEVLSEEVQVMETLAPHEFMRFRDLLKPSSGFESQQFRLLELASGLEDEAFLKLAERLVDMNAFRGDWPETLRTAFLQMLGEAEDPVRTLVGIYEAPSQHTALHALAEALSEYEMRFAQWRFHHVLLVERIIGDRAPGTGGSSGTAYLNRTVRYRFFPELWEARNQITERAPRLGADFPTHR